MAKQIDPKYWNFFLYKCIQNKGGFHTHHTNTMNKLYSDGIKTIIDGFKMENVIINTRKDTVEDREIEKINITVKLANAKIDNPVSNKDKLNIRKAQLPHECYINNTSYTGTLNLTVKVEIRAIKKDTKVLERFFDIPSKEGGIDIPILTGSNKCNQNDSTPEKNLTPYL